jgi:hypothetical protein
VAHPVLAVGRAVTPRKQSPRRPDRFEISGWTILFQSSAPNCVLEPEISISRGETTTIGFDIPFIDAPSATAWQTSA